MDHLDADVCVVGAGYAGLTAARRLTQAARSVVVLEARDRVGGRIWTWELEDGTHIDRGGAWVGPYHDAIRGLADDVGVSTYKTYAKGDHLLTFDGSMSRYRGISPKIGPRAVVSLATAMLRLDRMAKKVSVEAPWEGWHAAAWDTQTAGDWLDAHVRAPAAKELLEGTIGGLHTCQPDEVSLLHLLFLIRSAGGINVLLSIEGGYQENLVDGGAGSIAQRMAAELGDAVRLNAPVRAISQGPDAATIEADGVTVRAKHVVMTAPPALAADIRYDPSLPEDCSQLLKLSPGGQETKTIVVYDEPFWREDGLSGQTVEVGSPSEITLDASHASGRPGMLASFTFADNAARLWSLDAGERRRLLLDALAARLGPRAASPVHLVETTWFTEEWTRGCTMAHYAPGVLSRYGPLLREPVGRIHWAGTETATVSHGAIDGAVRSGERAATEILSLS